MCTENKSISTMIKDYNNYLKDTQGCVEGTRNIYCRNNKYFLSIIFNKKKVDTKTISLQEVIKYIIDRSKIYKPKTMKLVVGSLRSFFKYLYINGLIDKEMIDAIPTVQCRKNSNIPEVLTEEQLVNFLNTFNTDKPSDLRGKAIAMLMIYLGLRACEVAQLSLDDIDWDQGVLNIMETKNRKSKTFPLPDNVGKAIGRYILKGRPKSEYRHIFLKHFRSGQIGTPIAVSTIKIIVRRAYDKMDQNISRPKSRGTHILRHTAASRMINQGITIKEIADVLGHSCIDTTIQYTKINISLLTEVTMPWPEV